MHVGVDDLAPALLRRVVPPGFIIGASVGSDDEAARARGGATTSGSVPCSRRAASRTRATAIGAARFARARAALCDCPRSRSVASRPTNVGAVMAAGASGVAVISALFGAADPTQAARAIRSALDASGR